MQKHRASPQLGDVVSTESADIDQSIDITGWVEEHGDYLFKYAYRYFNNHELAEELVQDTLLAAVKAAKDFRGQASARTWLVGILRHKIIDVIRRDSRSRSVSFDDLGEEGTSALFDESGHWHVETGPRDWHSNPDKLLEQKEFLAVLQECLGGLPARLREVFVLRELEDLSTSEIGNSLAVSTTNVLVMIHRARLQLRQCLQIKWFDTSVSLGLK